MKNLVFNLAIALIVIAYVGGMSYEAKKEVKVPENGRNIVSQKNRPVLGQEIFSTVIEENKLKQKESMISMRIGRVVGAEGKINSAFPLNKVQVLSSEVMKSMFPYRNAKTIEEIIAEDNAITGNDSSNENVTDLVNSNLSIDNIAFDKSEKTIEEIIAEDNAITGNDSSNENVTDLVNANVSIDNIAFDKSGKTIEEIIAQDNAITENNVSNEVMTLDFK